MVGRLTSKKRQPRQYWHRSPSEAIAEDEALEEEP